MAALSAGRFGRGTEILRSQDANLSSPSNEYRLQLDDEAGFDVEFGGSSILLAILNLA